MRVLLVRARRRVRAGPSNVTDGIGRSTGAGQCWWLPHVGGGLASSGCGVDVWTRSRLMRWVMYGGGAPRVGEVSLRLAARGGQNFDSAAYGLFPVHAGSAGSRQGGERGRGRRTSRMGWRSGRACGGGLGAGLGGVVGRYVGGGGRGKRGAHMRTSSATGTVTNCVPGARHRKASPRRAGSPGRGEARPRPVRRDSGGRPYNVMGGTPGTGRRQVASVALRRRGRPRGTSVSHAQTRRGRAVRHGPAAGGPRNRFAVLGEDTRRFAREPL
ncbi:UNVERIFIED_ORG: hypothetical protein CLV66_101218 [Actinomadura viridilutea]